ncbi:hypothetical protein D3C72_2434330 [compost metagenome]
MVDLTEMMKSGEQLLQRALEAVGRYHEARDSSMPEDEVERLRAEADSLLRLVWEYQSRALGST